MKVSCWLRVTAQKTGYRSDVSDPSYFKATDLKVSKNKPDTNSNELAIKLDLDVPNSLFVKPVLNFKVSIPEEACTLPCLEAEVKDNLAEVLSEQIGQRVHLTIDAEGEQA